MKTAPRFAALAPLGTDVRFMLFRDAGIEFDQQVYIAGGIGLPSGYGTEDANIRGTIFGGDFEDLIAL